MVDAITDIHTHVNPLFMLNPGARKVFADQHEDFDAIERVVADPAQVVEHMDEAGVSRIGLVNYVSPDVTGYTQEVNDWVAQYASVAPDRFIPFGSVDPHYTEDCAAEVDRLHAMGIQALKIHPPHQLLYANDYRDGGGLPNLEGVYRRASELGMPVMVHTGTSIFPKARNKYGDSMALDDVIVDFPDLQLILAHGGRPLWMREALFLLRRRSGVYIDISSLPPGRLLTYFPDLERIADKVLYGSDWPAPGPSTLRSNIDAVLDLPIGEDAKSKILRDNAEKLFGPVRS